MGDIMIKREVIDDIEQSDLIAYTISWVLISMYFQVFFTFLAVAETTLLNYILFLLTLTAFFIATMCYVYCVFSPRFIYIVKE